ncbi:MAG: hypothetical protein AAGG51_21615 [Cyanobacteria bacterium P01_G01_bin.54]
MPSSPRSGSLLRCPAAMVLKIQTASAAVVFLAAPHPLWVDVDALVLDRALIPFLQSRLLFHRAVIVG